MRALRYFDDGEFDRPEELNEDLLEFLDQVRYQVGVPFYITSDFRSDERNEEIGGSPSSWHLTGDAIDFVPDTWDSETLWAITYAVMTLSGIYSELSVEFELVSGPTDKHIHLGLSDTGGEPDRLILALD